MSDTTVLWQFVSEAITFIFICYVMIGIGNQIGTPTPKAERQYRRAVAQEKFDARQRRDEADRQAQKENRAAVGRWLRNRFM